MTSSINLSVVVPVYNSADSFPQLIMRLHQALADGDYGDYEIIAVDDCSPDQQTWATVAACAASEDGIKAVRLTRTVGQQLATLCGLALSSGRHIITMDDDGQHRPEDILRLFAERSHDVVVGQFSVRQHSWGTRLTSAIKSRFDEIVLGKPANIRMSAFRLLSRPIVDAILTTKSTNPFIPALMFSVTRDVVGVPVTHDPRIAGQSGYNFWKRFRLFTNLLINNSAIPLRLLGLLGVTSACISGMLVIWLILERVLNDAIPAGWTSVMVAILFFGGMMLFGMALLGEYLLRIISSVERKRAYFIRESVGFQDLCDESAGRYRGDV